MRIELPQDSSNLVFAHFCLLLLSALKVHLPKSLKIISFEHTDMVTFQTFKPTHHIQNYKFVSLLKVINSDIIYCFNVGTTFSHLTGFFTDFST